MRKLHLANSKPVHIPSSHNESISNQNHSDSRIPDGPHNYEFISIYTRWKYRRKRRKAFNSIRDGCDYFKFIESKSLMNDKEFVFELIQTRGDKVIEYMSDALKDDKNFALKLLGSKDASKQRSLLLLAKLSLRLQNDRDVVMLSVTKWGETIQFASKNQRDDKEIMLVALRKFGSLEFASERLKDDRDVVIEAISCSSLASLGTPLRFASHRIQADPEIVVRAINHDPAAINFAAASVLDDEISMLKIVSRWGHLLEYASDRLKDLEHLVTKALEQFEAAFLHVSPRLKRDKNFNLEVVSRCGDSLKLLPVELRCDKDVVLAALNNDPIALRYALGGLNQDRDCLVASGIWEREYNQQNKRKQTRIVLSTRFSFAPDSSTTSTEFTLLFKSHPFFKDRNILLYAPNAFDKRTCDPQWTRMEWPCRGTPDTCKMIDDMALQTLSEPTTKSCWRYSYRYQLEEARRTNGYMIQVIELVKGPGGLDHTLGKGQAIEAVMASKVGVKVFRVFEPGYMSRDGKIRYPEAFTHTDIDSLVMAIANFLNADQRDITPQDINFSLPMRLS